jgi:hypothetical protein
MKSPSARAAAGMTVTSTRPSRHLAADEDRAAPAAPPPGRDLTAAALDRPESDV